MRAAQETFIGGFADPVFDAQAAFRLVMDGMAQPGTIAKLPGDVTPPQPLGKAQAIIALTLCDHDTPVHLTSTLLRAGLGQWLAFHTGAPLSESRSEALFAFSEPGIPLPLLSAFARGSQDYPDRSTTVQFEVESLEGGEPLTLSGPGIKDATMIAPKSLPAIFPTLWAENHALFPRGVDLILTSGRRFLCLPRSVSVARKESF